MPRDTITVGMTSAAAKRERDMGHVHLGDGGEEEHRKETVVRELLRARPEFRAPKSRQSLQYETEGDERRDGKKGEEYGNQAHRLRIS
ncbi:hypothetical protein GCM10009690_04480 [Brevibacterium permense]|uniref:Uncharacterized protein n=1 Tax=Brevibacterium permense TaxID=234834 RepID=A0ABP4KPM4_9MICO